MRTAGPCQTATSPIDITSTDQVCSKICDYKFSYPLSDCKLSNEGEYLSIITSNSDNIVTFNNIPYDVVESRLYHPSLHTYNGAHADAELIIQHMGAGGRNLLVCIPVMGAAGNSKSIDFFNAFVPYAPQNEGTQTNVNVTTWSLGNVIPTAGYYFYQATAPFPPCTGIYNIVVFDKSSAAQILTEDLPHLTSVISQNSYIAKNPPSAGFYYNSSGTLAQGVSSSEIYIDCQPVGEEEEEEEIHTYNIPKFDFQKEELEFKKIMKSKWGRPIILIGSGILLLVLLKKIYDKALEKLF